MSETVQYTVVGIIILLAIIWAAYKTARISKGKESGCSGCSLSDTCGKARKERCEHADFQKD